MSSPAHSSASSDYNSVATPPQPAPASVVQTVNIRSHVPVTLDIADSNYSQWRCFFDSAIEKFGLEAHIYSPPPLPQRNATWRQVDHCVSNWIYTTVSKEIFDIVHKPRATAFTIWTDIESLFRDNEMQRAVYLEAEFRSVQQGDLSVTQYCSRLKHLADSLRDVGHPVSEPSQVLNLLCGLNPKFRHVKPVMTSKFPPHTFMSARSYLLLEEIQLQHDDKMEAGHALVAGHGSSSTGASSGSTDATAGRFPNTGKGKGRKRGRDNSTSGGTSGTPSSGGVGRPMCPTSAPWVAGYNPWTGLVQAWPMPFRAPGSDVLGPRPPFQPQHAMTAQHQPGPLAPADSSNTGGTCWDNAALYAALQSATTVPPPSSADWYFDTRATTHMSSTSGIFRSSQPTREGEC